MRIPALLVLALTASLASGQQVCFEATSHAVFAQPNWVAAGDVNQDGALDVLSTSGASARFSVLLGDGAGDFALATVFSSGSPPTSLAVGDVTGDGLPDVVIAHESASKVSVHAGNGAGSFTAAGSLTVGAEPRTVALADFDLDGHLDLVVCHVAGEELRFLFGDGSGGFEDPFSVETPGRCPHVAVADLDLDGDPDAVGANLDATTVTAADNAGDRTFTAVYSGFFDVFAWWVSLADLDEDGLPDLLVPLDDLFSHHLAAMKNVGGSSFGGAPLSTFLASTQASEAGDFDGDGHQDIVFSTTSAVRVMLGKGDGTFDFTSLASTGPASAAHIAVADVDGDGLDDVIAAHSALGSVSVSRTRTGFAGASLSACPQALSLADGGTQRSRLDLANAFANDLFLLLTTSAGTTPGLPLAPTSLTLPLNASDLLIFTATSPGLLIPGSLGFLDTQGDAELELALPPGLDPGLAGAVLHSAFVLLDLGTFLPTLVSNAAPLELAP